MLATTLALMAPSMRDLRPGTERKYRITVARDEGDRFEYRLRVKIERSKIPGGAKDERRLDLRMSGYRATVGGHDVSTGTLGGGLMPLEPNGLPGGLSVSGPQGPIWLPLLSFYLPATGDDGGFDVPPVDVGGLTLAGTGTWKRPRMDVVATLSRDGKELAKLTFGTTLDKGGWPGKSEGTLVSADGTYRFTLAKG